MDHKNKVTNTENSSAAYRDPRTMLNPKVVTNFEDFCSGTQKFSMFSEQ
jgi:hypothetical protein